MLKLVMLLKVVQFKITLVSQICFDLNVTFFALFQFLMKKYNLAPKAKKQSSEDDYGISAIQMGQQGDFFSSLRAEENDVIPAPVVVQED